MNYFFIVIVFIILSFGMVFLAVKKNFLIYTIIALVLFWGILGTVGFRYFTNQQFRLSVDLKFRQVDQHKNLTDKNIPSLPLPESTVFYYRYSDKAATYCTTLGKGEVTNYFKRISDKDTFMKDSSSTDEREKFRFNYKNTPFTLSIETSINPQGNYIYIDSNTN